MVKSMIDGRLPDPHDSNNPLEIQGNYMTSNMNCDKCGEQWIAIASVNLEYLGCPKCNHMNPAPPDPRVLAG